MQILHQFTYIACIMFYHCK